MSVLSFSVNTSLVSDVAFLFRKGRGMVGESLCYTTSPVRCCEPATEPAESGLSNCWYTVRPSGHWWHIVT